MKIAKEVWIFTLFSLILSYFLIGLVSADTPVLYWDEVVSFFIDLDLFGDTNAHQGNLTNVSYIKLNEVSGVCDLTINHSICSNLTGTYITG